MRSAAEDLCKKLDARALGIKFRHFRRRNFNGKMLDSPGEDRMSGNRWAVMTAARTRAHQPPAPEEPAAGGAGGAGDVPAQSESTPMPTSRRYRANPNRGVAGLGQEVGTP